MPLAPSLRSAAVAADRTAARPICLLLLPEAGHAVPEELRDVEGVVSADPPAVSYATLGRVPVTLADRLGQTQGKRLVRAIRRHGDRIASVVIFDALQYPTARGVLIHEPEAELWYLPGRAPAGAREAELHLQASARATVSPQARPAVDPGRTVVATSLGHLGWRTDWALLRGVCERMPELVLMLIGAWHDDECREDPDYLWCRSAPNVLWLGARPDAEAAQLMLLADVGIVPFARTPFNDAGLPYRILKYARLGRRTVSPDLAGVQTWPEAVTTADGPDAFVAALRANAGVRLRPDVALREWALSQTARAVDEPLWDRLGELGVDGA